MTPAICADAFSKAFSDAGPSPCKILCKKLSYDSE